MAADGLPVKAVWNFTGKPSHKKKMRRRYLGWLNGNNLNTEFFAGEICKNSFRSNTRGPSAARVTN
jgi:hypothetical protein